ncbi:hypothetical protein U1707_17700 [Sphingomonas sp. PB2P12]
MPIRPENRWVYPIDWPQLSQAIRFDRAGERCARPHRRFVAHLGDGRWWDGDAACWRSARGRRIAMRDRFELSSVRTTYVVLACAHLDHDPGHNIPANLAALCQRWHMLHDAAEHRWQRLERLPPLRAARPVRGSPPDARTYRPTSGVGARGGCIAVSLDGGRGRMLYTMRCHCRARLPLHD